MHSVTSLLLVLGVVAYGGMTRAAVSDPESGMGLAARYTDDVGIASDPDVILFLDYETRSWRRGWKSSAMKRYSLTTAAANVFRGRSALQQTLTPGNTGATMVYDFPKNKRYEKLYTRYYCKFPKGFAINSSMKVGGFCGVVPGKPTWWGVGRAGIKPTGYDKFYGIITANPKLRPGYYYYHVDQKGGYGDGKRFGSRFEQGRWYCVEIMLKLNDPARRDGEIRCWIDGKMVGEVTGLRWRLTALLQIATVLDQAYINKGVPSEQHYFIDNRVVATRYIGPIANRVVRQNKSAAREFVSVAARRKPTGPLVAYQDAITAAERQVREGNRDGAKAAYEQIAAKLGEAETAARDRISLRLNGLAQYEKLLALIVRGVEKQGPKGVYVDFAGYVERARLMRATRQKGTFEVKGSEIPLAWNRFSPVRLTGIAAKFATTTAERLAIAKFLVACGETDAAGELAGEILAKKPTGAELEEVRFLTDALR